MTCNLLAKRERHVGRTEIVWRPITISCNMGQDQIKSLALSHTFSLFILSRVRFARKGGLSSVRYYEKLCVHEPKFASFNRYQQMRGLRIALKHESFLRWA